MQPVIFAVLGAITLAAAVMVVISQSLFRSALWLVLSFLGVAGIFVLLDAEFLAVVQVLVYIGAISILIIFAIMLSRSVMDPREPRFNDQWGLAIGFAALLFVALAVIVSRITWPVSGDPIPPDSITRLGIDFVGTYAVPFEAASVLLVVAMIGAILIARERGR